MNTQKLYNTPMEIAVRFLVILERSKMKYDFDQLLYLDYFSLYSEDVKNNNYSNLHAPVPNRSLELYAREKMVSSIRSFLLSKGLIEIVATEKGFKYQSSYKAPILFKYFDSEYYQEFTERVEETLRLFRTHTAIEMKSYFENQIVESY